MREEERQDYEEQEDKKTAKKTTQASRYFNPSKLYMKNLSFAI